MISTIIKVFNFLTPKELRLALLLIFMTFISALVDLLGVASIFPFIAVASNPEIINSNEYLSQSYQILFTFGVKTPEKFLIFLGIASFLILIISLILKTLITYQQIYFVRMREVSISKRLIESYLNQKYSWFLSRNTSEIGKNNFI